MTDLLTKSIVISHHGHLVSSPIEYVYGYAPYGLNDRFVDEINRHQSSWKEYQNYTINDMIQRAGGRKGLPRVYPRLMYINKYTFL